MEVATAYPVHGPERGYLFFLLQALCRGLGVEREEICGSKLTSAKTGYKEQ